MTTRTSRQRTEYETEVYTAMLRRMVKGLGRRVAEGNPDDLAGAVELARLLDETIGEAARRMVDEQGLTWQQLGDALGMTRQGAYQRFGRKRA